MEAAIYLFLYLTSDEVIEGCKILAIFFCLAYPVSKSLISYNARELAKETEQNRQKQSNNTETAGMQESESAIAVTGKDSDARGKQEVQQLTEAEREMGRKILEQARNR